MKSSKKIWKLDFIILSILGLVCFLVTSLLLHLHGIVMYDFDSYGYYYRAANVWDSSEGFPTPFILFLNFLQNVFSDSSDQLYLIRIVHVIFTFQLVGFIYLIIRKILNPIFSASVSLMILFTPQLLTYSIVLHNDIFALSMGFASVYFSLKPRLTNIIIAFVFIIIASTTRLDMYPVFLIPFLINVVRYVRKRIQISVESSTSIKSLGKKKIFYYLYRKRLLGSSLILFVCIAIFLIFPFILTQDYYYLTTRFNPVERALFSLRYETIELVLSTSLELIPNELSNKVFLASLLVALAYVLISNSKKILRVTKLNYTYKDTDLALIYLTSIFLLLLVNTAVFHIGYTIVDGEVILSENVSPRYLIGLQTLLVFGFAFSVLIAVKTFYQSNSSYSQKLIGGPKRSG